MINKQPEVAIIGAGLAGISLAKHLTDFAQVSLFEKSRGVGGRMSVRRQESFVFDHGAQFFTARSKPFQMAVQEALAAGVIESWSPKTVTLEAESKPFKRQWFEPHYRGTTGMNSLAKYLATELNIQLEFHIKSLRQDQSGWFLFDADDKEAGPFDWIVSAAPAPQAVDLMPECFSERAKLKSVGFSGCFALMLGFEQTVALNFDTAVVRHPMLAWISANKSSSLLVHSQNEWASQYIDQPPAWVKSELQRSLQELIPELPVPTHCDLHRWRFARCEQAVDQRYLLDTVNRLGAIGDWCGGNRIEDAFLSGYELAQQLKAGTH